MQVFASNGILMTITVISVNDNPVASNDAGTTQEDVILLLPVITSNDTDVDGTVDASTVDLDPGVAGRQTAVSTAQGSRSVDASANLSYTRLSILTGQPPSITRLPIMLAVSPTAPPLPLR